MPPRGTFRNLKITSGLRFAFHMILFFFFFFRVELRYLAAQIGASQSHIANSDA